MVELSKEERFGLLRQGDAAQVTGDDSQTQPPLHPVLPVIGAFAPPVIASQARNASLDARTPPIPAPPAARVLQRVAFLRKLAGCWNSYQLHSRSRQALLGLGGMYPPVPR